MPAPFERQSNANSLTFQDCYHVPPEWIADENELLVFNNGELPVSARLVRPPPSPSFLLLFLTQPSLRLTRVLVSMHTPDVMLKLVLLLLLFRRR